MKPIYFVLALSLFGLGGELQAAKYRIEHSYPHGGPYLGKETKIQFQLFRGTETTPLKATDLQVEHEKLIHLMTIDSGFQEYLHEHPEEVSPGVWEVPVVIRTAGNYRFFLQFLPEDEITTKTVTFDDRFVKDPSQVVPSSPVKPQEQFTFEDGEFKVTINYVGGQKPVQKKAAEAYFTIEKNGAVIPFKDLDLYLGTQMHIAGISADKNDFVHAHPGEGDWREPDPKEITKVYFKQSGYYGLFMQYQYKGVVHTNQFALHVQPSP